MEINVVRSLIFWKNLPVQARRKHGVFHREHLGLMTSSDEDKEIIRDIVSDTFWKNVWLQTARRNTEIFEQVIGVWNNGVDCLVWDMVLRKHRNLFEQVFNCVPSDAVSSFSELEAREKATKLSDTDPAQARTMLEELRGLLVLFPYGFLRNENLQSVIFSDKGILPSTLWIWRRYHLSSVFVSLVKERTPHCCLWKLHKTGHLNFAAPAWFWVRQLVALGQ